MWEGASVGEGVKESNNISFINVDVSDEHRDGTRRGLRSGGRGVSPARATRHIFEVQKADTNGQLTVHVVVAYGFVVDPDFAQVREIKGSIQDEHFPKVRGGKT